MTKAPTDWFITLTVGLQNAESSQEIFELLKKHLIPQFADWCVLYLWHSDQGIEAVAAAHTDLAVSLDILEKARLFPPKSSDMVGVGMVVRTGQTEFLPDIPVSLLPALCQNDSHLALIRRLGMRSSLTLPVQQRQQTFAVLRLVRTAYDFEQTEVEIAEELVNLVGIALAVQIELEQTRFTLTRERRQRRMAQIGQSRYKALLKANPISTQILNQEGRTLEVNRAWEAFWGIRLEDDPSYHHSLYENQQLHETGVIEFFTRALSGEDLIGPPTLYDTSQHTPGGQMRWIRTRATPVRSTSGKVREVIVLHEELSALEQEQAIKRLRALGVQLPEIRGHSIHMNDPLSPRERAVLQLIAAGHSNKEIARLLNISENTAKFHVTGLFNKLGVNSRAMAVSNAVQKGLL
jgi:DNA-binding CsgD family transcriptional regulator/PAS domain-containing protein